MQPFMIEYLDISSLDADDTSILPVLQSAPDHFARCPHHRSQLLLCQSVCATPFAGAVFLREKQSGNTLNHMMKGEIFNQLHHLAQRGCEDLYCRLCDCWTFCHELSQRSRRDGVHLPSPMAAAVIGLGPPASAATILKSCPAATNRSTCSQSSSEMAESLMTPERT